ncbi:response regulator [Alkalinema sp. FACHB-956]|uniref:response regulator n=1 Tax=Alkalinema sp. FACHB-956 TaxID=2692768 RepID=UPI0016842E35|nr:response regulator [Alkalinema sp. FACHB-956]MBD2329540.1 response regulator [Alkalinema sp. FACHB-956]
MSSSQHPSMGRPIEILLVEDSPSDANLTIRNLENGKLNNHIHWVEDGDSAMAYLHQEGEYSQRPLPDIILLDLNLPGMDGREVLEAIKTDPHLRHIPVVVLTTSDNEVDILAAYQMSANCYITKPVDIHQFIQVIRLINDFWLTIVKLPNLP